MDNTLWEITFAIGNKTITDQYIGDKSVIAALNQIKEKGYKLIEVVAK